MLDFNGVSFAMIRVVGGRWEIGTAKEEVQASGENGTRSATHDVTRCWSN